MDKIFKQKLAHHTVPVADDLWDRIEAKLPPKKRKPKFFPLALAIVPIIGLLMGYLVYSKLDNVAVMPQIKVNQSPIAASVSSPSYRNSAININSNSNISFPIEEVQGQFAVQNNNNTNSQNSDTKSIVVNNSSAKNTTASIIPNKNNRYNESNAITTKQDLINTDFALSGDNETIENQGSITAGLRSIVETQKLKTNYSSRDLASIGSHEKLGLFQNSLAIVNKHKSQGTEPLKACPFGSESQHKSLDVYYSSDFNTKNLGVYNTRDQELADMRNNTEYSQYSYSAGIRFGYNVSYRWNLHTGINFSEIKEKFKYEDPESSQTRLITIKDYIYQNGRIVDSVITQEIVKVPGTMQYNVANSYRTVDIPIIGRYVIAANDLMSLSGTVGTMINISMRQRGMIINEGVNLPEEITSGTDRGNEVFRSQLGLSPILGLSLALHLTEKIDFLLEPTYKFQAQSITKGDYPLSQKYATYGISTGLRYNF